MKTFKKVLAWPLLLTLTLGVAAVAGFAQDHGRGHNPQFSDHDRQAIHSWQDKNHEHPPVGFREQDRLSPALESQLRVGVVLDRDLRGRIHPVPHALLITLATPPPHYRYVVIGDHVCLIDSGFHLVDVIHLELNF